MKNFKYVAIVLGIAAIGVAAYTYFTNTNKKSKRRNIQIVRR